VDRADRRGLALTVARGPAGLAAVAALGLVVAAQGSTPTPASPPRAPASTAAADGAKEVFPFPPLGTVHVYAPEGPPAQVVLFLSGDGGWNLGVVPMAERLAAEGALVAGVDVRRLLASLAGASPCAYPAGTLEELARAVELRHRLPEYVRPILVGYSSGATLVYAALAQAPAETFRGAISLGFCAEVSLETPLCRGRGLASRPRARGRGRELDPLAGLNVPWTVLQGDIDQVCAPRPASAFVSETGSARIVRLPKVGHGFSVTSRWETQYVDAYRAIAAEAAPAGPAGAGPSGHGPDAAIAGVAPADPLLADLGLVEVEARGTPTRPALGDVFALILTGDGGWAEIDKALAARFAASGVPCVGWSSLKYYWRPRTPDAAAADLARTIEHYARRWQRRRVAVVGYSFGADVLPFLVNRLPSATRARVALVGLVGLSPRASFEFHVTGWLGIDRGEHPTAPEAERLAPTPVACVRGEDERDSACRALAGRDVHVVTLPGGHHFDGDYGRVADELLSDLR
jgi:type IV secretory pathway VirJ component